MRCGPEIFRCATQPPSPGGIRDVSRRAPESLQHGRPRSIDVDGHWLEHLPDAVPENLAPRPSVVCGDCSSYEFTKDALQMRPMAGLSVQELTELLSGPLGRRMIRYIVVQDPPRADLDRDKDVQDVKSRGHRGEEVAGDDGICMIVKECRPTLTRRLPWPPTLFQVLADGARVDEQAQLERKLVGDPFFTPTRILLCNLHD